MIRSGSSQSHSVKLLATNDRATRTFPGSLSKSSLARNPSPSPSDSFMTRSFMTRNSHHVAWPSSVYRLFPD